MTGTKSAQMWYLGEAGEKERVCPAINRYNQTLYAISPGRDHVGKNAGGDDSRLARDSSRTTALRPWSSPMRSDYADTSGSTLQDGDVHQGSAREARGYYVDLPRWSGLEGLQSVAHCAAERDNISCFYGARRGLYIVYPKIGTRIRGHERHVYYVIASRTSGSGPGRSLVVPDLRDDAGAQPARGVPGCSERGNQLSKSAASSGLGFYQVSCRISLGVDGE